MSVRDLPRGEDPERDKRLDVIYGSIYIGPPELKRDGRDCLMGCRVIHYGYDGTVIRDEVTYNTRLRWDAQ